MKKLILFAALFSIPAFAKQKVPGRYLPNLKRFILEDNSGAQYSNQNIFDFQIRLDGTKLIPIAGDWNGDGLDSVGLFDPNTSTFYLKNSNTTGGSDIIVQYGPPGQNWIPIVGDWNAGGRTTVGLFNPASATFYLKYSNTAGPADLTYRFGWTPSNFIPLSGDWTGKGYSTVGIYDSPSAGYFLKNSHGPGNADITFQFGAANIGQLPITGDWTNIGKDTVGAYHPYLLSLNSYFPFLLKNQDNSGFTVFNYPNRTLSSIPISGRWAPGNQPAGNTSPPAPNWATDLILYQMRVDQFTPSGTFSEATSKMSYLADLGITGIVLNPIALMNKTPQPAPVWNNYYDVIDPGILDPSLGPESDFKNFVSTAHAAGIKVIVDFVPHGIDPLSPLIAQHPTWWVKDRNGKYIADWGTMYELDWTLPEVQTYWANTMLSWVNRFDIDGFRTDLDPTITGYTIWKTIRLQSPKPLFIISEVVAPRKNQTYHVSQEDAGINTPFGGPDFLTPTGTVCGFVKSPNQVETFYSSALSTHDRQHYGVKGRAVYAAYGSLLAPFIPFWFMGEEFNNPETMPASSGYGSALYFNKMTWIASISNSAFLNRMKQLIQIRKTYKSIIAPFPGNENQTRCSMLPTSGSELQAYALSDGTQALIILGRKDSPSGPVTIQVSIPGMRNVTNLTSPMEKMINRDGSITTNVNQNDVTVLKLGPL